MAKKTPTKAKVAKKVEDAGQTVEELQEVINGLKERNIKLEGEKAKLFQQKTLLEDRELETIEVEKIVEVKVVEEKIVEVEKIVNVPGIAGDIGAVPVETKFKVGDMVYYPEKYQRLNFEVRDIMGQYNGVPLYRLYNNITETAESFVFETSIFKF